MNTGAYGLCKPRILLTGKVFGRLTVQRLLGVKATKIHWECLCSCGVVTEVYGAKLTTGHTQSCGCLQRERTGQSKTTHGLSRKYKAEYQVWLTMRNRCRLPSVPCYPRYGGRGIKVCERWEDFSNFMSDMGPRPSSKHSIERNENDGHYEPSNCRWATLEEQANNKCTSHFIVIGEVRRTLTQWCSHFGVNPKSVATRISRGWDPIEALTTAFTRGSKCCKS